MPVTSFSALFLCVVGFAALFNDLSGVQAGPARNNGRKYGESFRVNNIDHNILLTVCCNNRIITAAGMFFDSLQKNSPAPGSLGRPNSLTPSSQTDDEPAECYVEVRQVCLLFHYITLHYITLHCITLHCITLHYITLHYITLYYIILHYIILH